MKKLFLVFCLSLVGYSVFGADTIPDPNNLPPFKSITLFKTTFSNETAVTTSRIPIEVPVASLMVFQVQASAAAGGVSNLTFSANTSIDSIVWTTTYPYSGSLTLNGTNVVVASISMGTNITGRYISIDKIATGQTNLVTVSNPQITFLPKP